MQFRTVGWTYSTKRRRVAIPLSFRLQEAFYLTKCVSCRPAPVIMLDHEAPSCLTQTTNSISIRRQLQEDCNQRICVVRGKQQIQLTELLKNLADLGLMCPCDGQTACHVVEQFQRRIVVGRTRSIKTQSNIHGSEPSGQRFVVLRTMIHNVSRHLAHPPQPVSDDVESDSFTFSLGPERVSGFSKQVKIVVVQICAPNPHDIQSIGTTFHPLAPGTRPGETAADRNRLAR